MPRIGSIEKRAEPRTYEASAMPAMLGAKRAAAINIDHVRVGTSKRLVLVRTSSEQEAQHEECLATSTNRGWTTVSVRKEPLVGSVKVVGSCM